MKKAIKFNWLYIAAFAPMAFMSCKKNHFPFPSKDYTITIQNVLQSQPLVESGTFQGPNKATLPGETSSFTFSAAKGQAVTFASMYGWSNDLFFAPANPGIKLYDAQGNPVEGDVSSQIKIWDNGTRINQHPGSSVVHPGTAETTAQNILEVNGTDAQGYTYLPASSLMHVSLKYNSNSMFTLTIENVSGGTANQTPFSPGVWTISYVNGGTMLMPNPIYEAGKPSMNGLTNIAEKGNITNLDTYLKSNTGIFTHLSPVLVVVYHGISNPIFSEGETDEGHGLTKFAQKGNASDIAGYLETVRGVDAVYVLPATNTTRLLPAMNGNPGSSVSQKISLHLGDHIAFATMYGFSNDWFFAGEGGMNTSPKGGIYFHEGLYDDGTAVDQFPGAGNRQAAFGGTPQVENKPIMKVPNPNAFTTLPDVSDIVKVTIE